MNSYHTLQFDPLPQPLDDAGQARMDQRTSVLAIDPARALRVSVSSVQGFPSGVAEPAVGLRPMVFLTVLVPKFSNAGVAFPRLRFLHFEEYLRSRIGGFTREADVDGEWSQGDRVFRDRLRKYDVLAEQAAASDFALDLDEYVRREFGQLAVCITMATVWSTMF